MNFFYLFKCPMSIPAFMPGESGQHCFSCIHWSLVTFLFASFSRSRIYIDKLASKNRTSKICLLTSKNVFDLNQKHFCLPTCKMLNKRWLKNLVVVKTRTGYSNYLMWDKQCWSVLSGLKEQKHEFYHSVICLVTTFHSMYFKLTQPWNWAWNNSW